MPKTLLIFSLLFCPLGCKKDTQSGKNPLPEPVSLDASNYTYRLSESTDALTLWTAPCTHKVRSHERPPEDTRSGLLLSAARREFEPAQVVLGPGTGVARVQVDPFPDLGSNQRLTLSQATYEDGWAEQLEPMDSGDVVVLREDAGIPIWITVYVPEGAPAGNHTTQAHFEIEGTSIDIPIQLTVFDFSLPEQIHFASQLNVDVSSLIPAAGTVDDAKNLLFEHRLTPKSVTWPSGFRWDITWDNSASSDRCETFWDEPNEPDPYSIGWLSQRYILGRDWNEIGFPNAMLFQFVNNSTPRPDELCGIPRGDHYGTSAYNTEWTEFLGALNSYLVNEGFSEKAYYYVQNEPQNEEDHDLAAYLCELTKTAAPNLRIAISEEPKPEIAENGEHPCGYDIWIAHVRAYQENYAWERQRDHGEAVWLYSLDHDPDPYFNPTRIDLQGIHQRIIPWVSWVVRATGWAYYDANRFFTGSHPTIRAELLREGFEDYEYLFLANNRSGGGSYPQVFGDNAADLTAKSVATSLTSWTRNPDALMALRHELGRYIEGSRDTLPTLEVESAGRPRGSYYINFQDPTGEPTAEPLAIQGKTYLKVGWAPYSEEKMYGWYGEYVTNSSIALYGYDRVEGYSDLARSYVYDDYGRDNLFEFALENGTYEITIGAGRPARGYPNDPHHVTVEGIVAIDDEPTTDLEPTFVRQVTVTLTDGSLSIEMGGYSASASNWAYTFLAFIEIEPVDG